ncbi:hypothetical protein ACFL6Y_07205 [Elusimicrobiota bacterium]
MKRKVVCALCAAYVPIPSDLDNASIEYICGNVFGTIEKLPWFYRWPVSCYLIMIELSPVLLYLRRFSGLSLESRRAFMRTVLQRLPFYAMISELLRTLVILSFFDVYDK